jgi:hypothetical protein
MIVHDFRRSALYQRSLDLCKEVYRFVKIQDDKVMEKEAIDLRRKAVSLVKKVAIALIQQNVKMQFKKLNEAKKDLMNLEALLQEFSIDEFTKQRIADQSVQVIRLLNYSFSRSKRA